MVDFGRTTAHRCIHRMTQVASAKYIGAPVLPSKTPTGQITIPGECKQWTDDNSWLRYLSETRRSLASNVIRLKEYLKSDAAKQVINGLRHGGRKMISTSYKKIMTPPDRLPMRHCQTPAGVVGFAESWDRAGPGRDILQGYTRLNVLSGNRIRGRFPNRQPHRYQSGGAIPPPIRFHALSRDGEYFRTPRMSPEVANECLASSECSITPRGLESGETFTQNEGTYAYHKRLQLLIIDHVN